MGALRSFYSDSRKRIPNLNLDEKKPHLKAEKKKKVNTSPCSPILPLQCTTICERCGVARGGHPSISGLTLCIDMYITREGEARG